MAASPDGSNMAYQAQLTLHTHGISTQHQYNMMCGYVSVRINTFASSRHAITLPLTPLDSMRGRILSMRRS